MKIANRLRNRPRKRLALRPWFEQLEDRCLLSSGTWQELNAPAGFVGSAMVQLSNGNVLMQNNFGNNWRELQPDATGSYVNGTFPANLGSSMPTDASGANARNTADSVVLPDGRIFELGGEYASTGKAFLNSGVIFDPTALDPQTGHLGTWTLTRPAPIIWDGQTYLGDTPTVSLSDGTVLVGNNNGAAVHVGGDLNTLNAAADATTTTLTVFAPYMTPTPPVPFMIDVEHEIMTVTAVTNAGTSWTVMRGQDGTTGAAHGDGTSIDLVTPLTSALDATSTTVQVADSASFPKLNTTTLSAPIDAMTTTITLTSTVGFPKKGTASNPLYPFPLMVGQELMTVTAIDHQTNTLTVIRGVDGTTAVAHTTNDAVTTPYYIQLDQEILFVTGASGNTLTVERGSQGTTAVAHPNGDIVHLSSDYGEELIYDPTSDTWTTLPMSADKINDDSAFEESYVKLPGTAGKILAYSNNATFEHNQSQAQVFDPTTQTWTATQNVPIILTENVFSNEIGPALALPNGKIFQIGGQGYSALYTPSSNSWSLGPQTVEQLTTLAAAIPGPNATTITVTSSSGAPATPFFIEVDQEVMKVTAVNGTSWTVARGQYFTTAVAHANGANVMQFFIAGDDPAAELPDGEIIYDASQQIQAGATTLFDYDSSTNTTTPMDTTAFPADLTNFLANNADDNTSMIVLPTGQLLLSDGVDRHLFVYTPANTTPAGGSQPTVTGVVSNGDGTFTLSGTQLNGISEGAFFGDDEGMSENYPLIQLTSAGGTVSYARSFGWSSTDVATWQTPETTKFVLPTGLAAGTYQLVVTAAGISSQPFAFTVDLSVAVTASPAAVTAGSAITYTVVVANRGTVGVTGATVTDLFPTGANGFISVTYTRTFSSASSGSSTPASGSGTINDTINLAAGDSATYVVTAVVGPSSTGGALADTASVGLPAGLTDVDPADNTSTSTVTVAPLPITGDVTAQVVATLSRAPGKKKGFIYVLTIMNNGTLPVLGPLNVVLTGLKHTIKLRGAAGFVGTGKHKVPFVAVDVPGGALAPGGSVTMMLHFSEKPNHVTPTVFADTAPQE
jgi:uncharacterized repeat protein (TIGR01451 family)